MKSPLLRFRFEEPVVEVELAVLCPIELTGEVLMPEISDAAKAKDQFSDAVK